MSGFYLRVKSTNSRIRTYFSPPIELGDGQKYEMALIGLEITAFPTSLLPITCFVIAQTMVHNPTPYTSQKEVMKLMRLTIIFKLK